MEQLRDRELSIVGEAYASFSEAYRVNGPRALNAFYEQVGDRSADARAEVEPGVWFSPEQTKEALLFGYEGFSDAFARSQARMERLVAERYEWRADERRGTDVYGANVIVERVAAGHPETFTRPRRQMRKKRSARILYDTMCAASTPLHKRVEAACAVMAAARALEHVGYEARLDFSLARFSGNSMAGDATLLLLVALKDYGEPFVASRMEFPLAAKSVLFHLGCFWAHRFAGTPMDYGPGEGYPLSYDPRRVKAMEAFAAKRGAAYLSEDIVEVQLAADPVRVLERVLGVAGDSEALALHVRRKTAMNVAASPKQGKLFSGHGDAGAGRHAQGEGESPGKACDAAPCADAAAPGEGGAPVSGGARSPQAPRPLPAADERDTADAGGEGAGDAQRGAPGEGDAGAGAPGAAASGATAPDDASAPADAGDAAARGARGRRGTWAAAGGGDGRAADDAAADGAGGGQGFAVDADGSAGDGGISGDAGVSFTPGANDDDSGDGCDGSAGGDGGRDGSAGDGGQAGAGRADEGAVSDDEDGAEGMGEQGAAAEESRDEHGKKAASMDTDGRDGETGAMSREQPEPEREEQSLERDDDPFVVMLRKRFVRFEEGAYREQVESERARAEAHREGRTPPAPPITAENSEGGFKLGAPRNTPFSISYVPKKK